MIDTQTAEVLANAAYDNALNDVDIETYAEYVYQATMRMLDYCDYLPNDMTDDYELSRGNTRPSRTRTIIGEYMNFACDTNLPGGSAADYCAEAVCKAFADEDVQIIVVDSDGYMNDVEYGIANYAVDSDREINKLRDAGIIE